MASSSAAAWNIKGVMPKKITILVVDDSALIRRSLNHMLKDVDFIDSVHSVSNGKEGIYWTMRLKPDVVLLDLEMPEMNGFSFLRWLMRNHPVPCIVISSADSRENILRSFELGAVDFIAKPDLQLKRKYALLDDIRNRLLRKIATVSQLHVTNQTINGLCDQDTLEKAKTRQAIDETIDLSRVAVCFIGASTGGPGIIARLLRHLPAAFPVPILVGIHMPKYFTRTFAQRLAAISPLEVLEARNRLSLIPGRVIVAKGGYHLKVRKQKFQPLVLLEPEQDTAKYVPSLDSMLLSLAESYFDRVLSIILTGMGDDGLTGVSKLKQLGTITITQKAESCIVYGMPRAIAEKGLSDMALDVEEIQYLLQRLVTVQKKQHNTTLS